MAKVADNKTKETNLSVTDFINSLPDEQKKKDSKAVIKLMEKASKEKPKVWGSSIIGFGNVRITSPSGRVVDWFRIGFAPRKANLTLYLTGGSKGVEPLLKKLGKYKTQGGCLYINKLEDVDTKVLEDIINTAAKKEWFADKK